MTFYVQYQVLPIGEKFYLVNVANDTNILNLRDALAELVQITYQHIF